MRGERGEKGIANKVSEEGRLITGSARERLDPEILKSFRVSIEASQPIDKI